MVTPAELLDLSDVEKYIQKFLFNHIFFTILVNNWNHQAPSPFAVFAQYRMKPNFINACHHADSQFLFFGKQKLNA